MNRTSRFALCLVALLIAGQLGAATAPAAIAQPTRPVVSFTPTSVVVAGTSPGARVLIASIARVPRRYYSEVVRRTEMLTDSDNDGRVELSIPEGVPHRAIWMVADLSAGSYVILPTTGYDNTPLQFLDPVKHDNNGQLRKLSVPFGELQLFVYRPGAGAWWLEAKKETSRDENRGQDRDLLVDMMHLSPIGDAPGSPAGFRKGDVLLFVNPLWMQYFTVEVGP